MLAHVTCIQFAVITRSNTLKDVGVPVDDYTEQRLSLAVGDLATVFHIRKTEYICKRTRVIVYRTEVA